MGSVDEIKIKEENIHKFKGYLDDDKIPERSFGFATSLFEHFKKKGYLSDKQWFHVFKFVDLIDNPPPPPKPEDKLPNINGVYSLMRRAVSPKSKSFPKLWLQLKDSDLRINRATERSKYKGQLMLTDGKEFGCNIFFGRIDTNGDLYLSHSGKEVKDELIDLLTRLINDPEKVASEYGKLTGNCFACHRQLSDDRSIEVGYGKVCADKFGLRWG